MDVRESDEMKKMAISGEAIICAIGIASGIQLVV